MFNKFDEMPVYIDKANSMDDLVKRACFGEDKLSALYCEYPAGFRFSPHKHEHVQLTICLEGAIEYTIGDETCLMTKYDTAYIPSNVLHSAVTKEPSKIIDVFNPVRMDHMAWFDPSIKCESVLKGPDDEDL